MKERIFVVFICVLMIGLAAGVFSQSFDIMNHHVKKQTTGVINTQMDTVQRIATDGTSVTGGSAVINGLRSDTLWSIQSTGVDTSRVNRVKSGRITFGFKFANDSTDIKFKLHAAQDSPLTGSFFPSLADFVLIDSITVSSNSKAKWVYTSAGSNRPNWDFFYLDATGGGDNVKLSANTGTVIVSY